MINFRLNQYKNSKKLNIRILFLIFSLIFTSFVFKINLKNFFIRTDNYKIENRNISAELTWGWVNFTNSMINETRFFHNEIVPIEGRLFHLMTDINWSGKSVTLKVDGVNLSQYTDLTDQYGKFKFDYLIPNSSNIYTDHKFEAVVNDPDGAVIYLNYLIINFSSYSTFSNINPNFSITYS